MPVSLQEEIAQMLPPTDDPERLARRVRLARLFVDTTPGVKEQLADELKAHIIDEARPHIIDEARPHIIDEARPHIIDEAKPALVNEGKLVEARRALRRVLVRRGFLLTAEQDARIEGCDVLLTLERWHDDAVTASSVDDALR